MMKSFSLLALLALAITVTGCKPNDPPYNREEIERQAKFDKAEADAKVSAQRGLPIFYAYLDSQDPDVRYHGVKFAPKGREQIWVNQVRRDGDDLKGIIGQVPVNSGYAQDDEITILAKDITDWSVYVHGRIEGNFLVRRMLDDMPKEEADAIRKAYGWD